MSLFTEQMTVYNYRIDEESETDVWYRTVIRGIQWTHNKKEISTSNGVQTENKVESITIDFGRSYENKPYIPPNEYRKLPIEECLNYWTLDSETGQDVLVLGTSDKEISREYRLSELAKDFQYTGTITSVSDNRNRGRLKHIKVVCG